MQLLSREAGPGAAATECLLLGLGLIGASLSRQLQDEGFTIKQTADAHWRNRGRRIATFEHLAASLGQGDGRLHIAWCAGSGSFSADEQALKPEVDAFDDLLTAAGRLSQNRALTFHFVSSAGALFERQVGVDRRSRPVPRSAYGAMKLRQEEHLLDLSNADGTEIRIYRPSTVYGSHAFHRRAGLVSHVMWNALRREPTALEANLHALRDFVHHDDVGRYLARAVSDHRPNEQVVAHLVSAKPSSILEVFRLIERLIGRSMYYRLRLDGGNDANITFSADIRPDHWSPVPLDVGLAGVWRETRKTFLTETPLPG